MEETDRVGHQVISATSATRRDTSLESAQEKEKMVARAIPTSVRGETTKVTGAVEAALTSANLRLLRGEKTGGTVALRRAKCAAAKEREVGVPGATLPTLMGEAGELVIALRFVYCPKRDSVYTLL